MVDTEGLTRDYRIAFLRYLGRPEEAALTAGYAWGRRAVSAQVSLLDVVQIHHGVLTEVLETEKADRLPGVVAAASAFLLEVVAPYDMTRLGLLEAGERGAPPDRDAVTPEA